MKKAETFTSILDLLKEYTVKISAFYLISFIKMTIIWSFRGERGFRGESVKLNIDPKKCIWYVGNFRQKRLFIASPVSV